MPTPYLLRINCDNVVSVDVMDQLTGQPINEGTVQIIIRDQNGNALPGGTFTLERVPSEVGLWRTVIPAEFTNTLTRGKRYIYSLQIDTPNGRFYGESEVEAQIIKLS